MKRILILTIMCISLITGLSACNGGNGASTQNMPERDFADMTENYVPPKPVVDAATGAFGLIWELSTQEGTR